MPSFNPTTRTYRPGRPGMDGRRGSQARELRAICSEHAYNRRQSEFPHVCQYVPSAGWTDQAVTPFLVDGLHPHNISHRMFGPAAALLPSAVAQDHGRRVMHFDISADRIISTARMADMFGPAWEREASYRAAFIAERRRTFAARHAAQNERRARCIHEWHSAELETGAHIQTCRLCGSSSR